MSSQNSKETLTKRILVAGRKQPADLVIQGGTIVNVFTGEPMQGDIAITDGVIAGIGTYEGKKTVQAHGKWIIPGLIDGHVHIESSMLTPQEFAKVVIQHGVTTVITDPHEIGNVAGTGGIQYMLDRSDQQPVDIYTMMPSCVPSTSFETNGVTLRAEDLNPLYKHPKVRGLAEVMDFPALAGAEPDMLQKIADAHAAGKLLDGHAAGIASEDLNIYMAAGIRTDHECVSVEEARQRLELGMYLMIREGTVAKDLKALLPAVTAHNARRCLFVTDDKLIDDLLDEGSVDHNVRLAIQQGMDPIMAIQIASINAAECFRLYDRGAIAPGYMADLLIIDDLQTLSIHQVYKRGVCVVDHGKLAQDAFPAPTQNTAMTAALTRLNAAPIDIEQLAIPLTTDRCHIIELVPNSLVTRHIQETVDMHEGCFQISMANDQLKLVVVERHHATGNIGRAIVKGFQFQRGAIVSTVAHDSHNIIAAGTSDQDILTAVQHVISIHGGLAVVADGEVLASLPLPVGGLLSEQPYEQVYEQMMQLNAALKQIGAPEHFNPFLTLSFLALPVIPNIKLTDQGLFGFASYGHIDIEVAE